MKRNALYWKAFWSLFGGISMIAYFDLLPLALLGAWYFAPSDVNMLPALVLFALWCVIGFMPFIAIATFGAISVATATCPDRTKRLWAVVAKGNDLIFFWNPVGIAFVLFCVAWYALPALRCSSGDSERAG